MNSIWAIGRNYSDHAKEMGVETPTEPLVFLKAFACLNYDNSITIPPGCTELHHELEIAIKLNDQLLPSEMALALDLTARDWQNEAKRKGQPWTKAKSFTGSCPIGPWVPYPGDEAFAQIEFHLLINTDTKQIGKTANMVFSVPQLIGNLQARFPLRSGDIILTGTPSGVGTLHSEDKLEAKGTGFTTVNWQIQ